MLEIYYVTKNEDQEYLLTMDTKEYKEWFNSYIGDAKEVKPEYMEFSDVCISIMGNRDEWESNIIIEDDPNKSREELALDMLEAYRVYSASLPKISENYFDELKVISLESYGEEDSDPETLIGEITADILRFDVHYAVNADNMVLAGSWDEGTGEYEGYKTNSVGFYAVRYNGKWYLTGVGNG